MSKVFSVLILAAGKGTRMNNPNIPKVLAELHKKPLLSYVLDTSIELKPSSINVIVGYQKDKVIDKIAEMDYQNISFVEQVEQLGTGHAVAQAKELFEGKSEDVLILSGDVPLLTAQSLSKFIEYHIESQSYLTVLSANADDPSGYGRIIRDADGSFLKIVEHKDASEAEKEVNEINSGIYFVNSEILFDSLEKVKNNNAQAEYYLTDIVEIIKGSGKKVSAVSTATFEEIQGVNTNEQLSSIEAKSKGNTLTKHGLKISMGIIAIWVLLMEYMSKLV